MACNARFLYEKGALGRIRPISRIYNLIDREIAITKWPLLYFTWSGTSLYRYL